MLSTGSNLLARSLKAAGVSDFFFLIGGPTTQAMDECVAAGLRGIDVRDERAATFAAIAYSRMRLSPGVVLTGSGPDTTNTVTGLAHAAAEGAPVVVVGGSAPLYQRGMGAFQELDQLSLMRPVTKWAQQVMVANRIPESVRQALQMSMAGRPGPVYLDVPADVLYEELECDPGYTPQTASIAQTKSVAPAEVIEKAAAVLAGSTRPVMIVGSGALWSQAASSVVDFASSTGIPVFTTPTARGVFPEQHPQSFHAARSMAFREADCVLLVGTRVNYVLNWLSPPVMDPETVIAINLNGEDMTATRNPDLAILGDVALSLQQLQTALASSPLEARLAPWTERLATQHQAAVSKAGAGTHRGQKPIHPLELCEVLDEAIPSDAIRVVDGHEILGFSRRGLTTPGPGRMLTPGPFGTMGVGVPFGIGAKVSEPRSTVVVLTGDGAFGFHAMELDTAVRHGLGILVVIANNAGWTGARGGRPGRDLGKTPYHRIADVVGGLGLHVERPEDLKPTLAQGLEHVARQSTPAVINVDVAIIRSEGRTFIQYDRTGKITDYQPA